MHLSARMMLHCRARTRSTQARAISSLVSSGAVQLAEASGRPPLSWRCSGGCASGGCAVARTLLRLTIGVGVVMTRA